MIVVPKYVGFLIVLLASACSGANAPPVDQAQQLLSSINETERNFLFGGSTSSAAFFGQPIDGGPIGCYPQRMNQAYVLVDKPDGVYIDSVRPTSVERHQITSVVPDGRAYTINAKNAAGAPFALKVNRLSNDQAMISWDGTKASKYQRCERPDA
jgi:hypothetical protein